MKNYKDYLYGAYGSNLNFRQMAYRCPNAIPVGTMKLQDYALRFRSVADIEKSKGDSVDLGLWRITADCEHRLDVYEGAPTFYRKELIKQEGTDEQVMVYIMVNQDRVSPPPHQYLHSISEGYMDFKLGSDCLIDAVKDSYANERKNIYQARTVKAKVVNKRKIQTGAERAAKRYPSLTTPSNK